jgi:osmotically-inducible protein OsmY
MATAAVIRSDEQIQNDVMFELKWDPRIHPNEVGVAVKGGIVTLMGSVDSYTKHWAAEEAARRVRSVKAVVNEIEVKLPVTEERSDEDIAAAAIQALEWDAAVPSDTIRVTVAKAWVTLEGEVEWQFQKEDAEKVVRRLIGVRGVINSLNIKPRVAPAEIQKRIEQAFRRAATDIKNISVEVEGSKVVLKGTVRSFAEKEEAERAAWSARGITAVDNQIAVSS